MKTCEYDGPSFDQVRSHPWTDSVANPDHRYYDLKVDPSRIRTSLEDLLPWAGRPGIEELSRLLERLNGPASVLESNDCAFSGPHSNESPSIPKDLQCSGRVMVLYRALRRNLPRAATLQLALELHRELASLDVELEWGMIGTTVVPVRYLTLPQKGQIGSQLMISFWAWGDSEREVLESLQRVVTNLDAALRSVTAADAPRQARSGYTRGGPRRGLL